MASSLRQVMTHYLARWILLAMAWDEYHLLFAATASNLEIWDLCSGFAFPLNRLRTGMNHLDAFTHQASLFTRLMVARTGDRSSNALYLAPPGPSRNARPFEASGFVEGMPTDEGSRAPGWSLYCRIAQAIRTVAEPEEPRVAR